MMLTLQWNIANSSIGNQVKTLQLDKDDTAKETYSTTKNPIYYTLRTNPSYVYGEILCQSRNKHGLFTPFLSRGSL